MNYAEGYDRRLLMKWDVAEYSSRDEPQQARLQDDAVAMVDWSAKRAGLRTESWERQQQGDGELVLLGRDDSEPRLLDEFVSALDWTLREHNRVLLPTQRLQVRVAAHHGVAIEARAGFAGIGVIVVSRLIDSVDLKAALKLTESEVGLIVSDVVFNDTIAQRHTRWDPAEFREVEVRVKEYRGSGHILVPGRDVNAIDLSGADQSVDPRLRHHEATAARQPDPADRKRPETPGIGIAFYAPVTAPHSHFGARYDRDS